MTSEQVFLPGAKDPILLRNTSPILFLLQQIRDEAHRVAITYNRSMRMKKTLRSGLDDIPGIGPTKKKMLLKHFGSLRGLREAPPDALLNLKGISKANVESILEFFKKEPE
jgi:excinuclease ABC subunit C